jgi:8-oxo-dGTP diphosphatase
MRGTTNIPIACTLFIRGSKLLVLRRAHTGYEDGKYSLPGGHVEARETFREAACREALEETGLHVTPDQLKFKLVMHELHPEDVRVFVLFEAVGWKGEPANAEPEKHDQITWLELDNLPDDLMNTLPEALAAAAAGQTYAEHGWKK